MSLIHDEPDALEAALRSVGDHASALVALGSSLPGGILNLRRLLDQLMVACTGIRSEVDEALLAIKLVQERPLAEEFPDGRPAPAVPSPRQVIYLANLAGGKPARPSPD